MRKITSEPHAPYQSYGDPDVSGRQPGVSQSFWQPMRPVMLPNLARRRPVLLDNVVFQICS